MKNRFAAGLAASAAVLLALTLTGCTSPSDQAIKDIRHEVPTAHAISDQKLLVLVNVVCRDMKNGSSMVAVALDSMAATPKGLSSKDSGAVVGVGMRSVCPDQAQAVLKLAGKG